MSSDLEKAWFLSALARGKADWGGSYDRAEHFKRFQDLKKIVKELSKINWVIIHKKPKFEAYSLNTKYKKEILEFIGKEMPELRGVIR